MDEDPLRATVSNDWHPPPPGCNSYVALGFGDILFKKIFISSIAPLTIIIYILLSVACPRFDTVMLNV